LPSLASQHFPAAMYVGMINTLGITEQDVDRFLKQ
jgi:hypothetical protein